MYFQRVQFNVYLGTVEIWLLPRVITDFKIRFVSLNVFPIFRRTQAPNIHNESIFSWLNFFSNNLWTSNWLNDYLTFDRRHCNRTTLHYTTYYTVFEYKHRFASECFFFGESNTITFRFITILITVSLKTVTLSVLAFFLLTCSVSVRCFHNCFKRNPTLVYRFIAESQIRTSDPASGSFAYKKTHGSYRSLYYCSQDYISVMIR